MTYNIFYTLFFGGLDFILYSSLTKSVLIDKRLTFFSYSLIVTVILLHSITNYLMNWTDFFNLLFYSIALIILHFLTNIQVSFFEKYYPKKNEKGQKVKLLVIKIFNFMRLKLIYIMCFITQLLSIWDGKI